MAKPQQTRERLDVEIDGVKYTGSVTYTRHGHKYMFDLSYGELFHHDTSVCRDYSQAEMFAGFELKRMVRKKHNLPEEPHKDKPTQS